MNTETKLDISTPKEQLPTKGFSVIVEAPQGYPIRDNARGKVIAVCAELSEATRIARTLASEPELLASLEDAISWARGRAPEAVVARYEAALTKAGGAA